MFVYYVWFLVYRFRHDKILFCIHGRSQCFLVCDFFVVFLSHPISSFILPLLFPRAVESRPNTHIMLCHRFSRTSTRRRSYSVIRGEPLYIYHLPPPFPPFCALRMSLFFTRLFELSFWPITFECLFTFFLHVFYIYIPINTFWTFLDNDFFFFVQVEQRCSKPRNSNEYVETMPKDYRLSMATSADKHWRSRVVHSHECLLVKELTVSLRHRTEPLTMPK